MKETHKEHDFKSMAGKWRGWGVPSPFKIQSIILDIRLISLNVLFVSYKRRYVHELSLFNIVLYNPTQLPFMNPPSWITVCGPFAPSGWPHFTGSDTKEIILWLWLLSGSQPSFVRLVTAPLGILQRWLLSLVLLSNFWCLCFGQDFRLIPGETRWYMVDQAPGLESEPWYFIPSFMP